MQTKEELIAQQKEIANKLAELEANEQKMEENALRNKAENVFSDFKEKYVGKLVEFTKYGINETYYMRVDGIEMYGFSKTSFYIKFIGNYIVYNGIHKDWDGFLNTIHRTRTNIKGGYLAHTSVFRVSYNGKLYGSDYTLNLLSPSESKEVKSRFMREVDRLFG